MQMRNTRGVGTAVATLAVGAIAASASADIDDRPFDFTDEFYLANGINPANIIGRPEPDGVTAVEDFSIPGPEFRPVRLLEHAACFDHSGHITYFHVLGLVTPDTFTDDAAGEEALQIAEEFVIYEFPRAANDQFAVFPKRQDAVVDLSGGYFSNDPLGLWKIVNVRYTLAAFGTAEGQDALADLAEDNGYDLDGTPIIKTLSEIESLESDGFVVCEIAPIGGPGLRWFMCPIPEDLTDGTIAPDAHVVVVEQPDGLPQKAALEHVREFNCLQATGDFCDNPCEADVHGDRIVNAADLAAILAAWGPCLGCTQDINGDNNVGAADLAQILASWGNCD